jgi:hypothetical protein
VYALTLDEPLLQKRFAQFLSWERIKRREKILVSVFFYSFLTSCMFLLAKDFFPPWFNPRSLPPLLFLVLALGVFRLHPWGERQSLRSLFCLDQTLQLQERAVTAWEILGRTEKRAPELLVLEETVEKLGRVDPRRLFRRKLSWHAFFAPPLFLLWVVLVWLDHGAPLEADRERSQSIAAAQKLKDFSHDLQRRAKSERLTESFKVARALEQVADESLGGEMEEKKLRQNLDAVAKRIGEMAQRKEEGRALIVGASEAARLELSELMEELEKFRRALTLPDSTRRESGFDKKRLRTLAISPRLREEMEKGASSLEGLSGKEMKEVVDKLEKSVLAELDRLTLSEIGEFLEGLLKRMDGKDAESPTPQAELDLPLGSEESSGRGSYPGDQPGTKGKTSEVHAPFQARAASHLRGLLGEGKSSSLRFEGVSQKRESRIPEEEILASYRRQAQEELGSEKIPEGLQEIIKRYFLSLGVAEEKIDRCWFGDG